MEMAEMKDELVSLNTTNASHRLILLHGWGADAEDLLSLGEVLQESLLGKIEVIAFRAPHAHPEGGGRQWYSLYPHDWEEAAIAEDDLQSKIEAISSKEFPLEKTFILGFSQGGAMALATGCKLPVAGIICCSSYPHPNWKIPQQVPPIFLTHGKNDDVVPLIAMKEIMKLLEKNNLYYNYELFEGGHEIPQNLLPKISKFIENLLKN